MHYKQTVRTLCEAPPANRDSSSFTRVSAAVARSLASIEDLLTASVAAAAAVAAEAAAAAAASGLNSSMKGHTLKL